MTIISKYGAILGAVGCLILSMDPAAAAVPNVVNREIRSEKGAVWVEDSLSLQEGYALRDRWALDVLVGVQQNKTNLSDRVRALMEGEDLEVQKFDAKMRGDTMDLRVLSRVAFKEAGKPARLRWVPFLAGQRITFHKGSIGRTNAGVEILIFKDAGAPVLWFPDLGWVNSNDITSVEVYRKGIAFVFDRADIEFSLHLKTGKQTQQLFFWNPGAKVPDVDSTSLFKISQFNQMSEEDRHRMSQNDLYTLTTDLKIAKPGYYAIDNSIKDGGK